MCSDSYVVTATLSVLHQGVHLRTCSGRERTKEKLGLELCYFEHSLLVHVVQIVALFNRYRRSDVKGERATMIPSKQRTVSY